MNQTTQLKVLHILNDGRAPLSSEIIGNIPDDAASEIVDLSAGEISYGELIDKIFACDKVISW